MDRLATLSQRLRRVLNLKRLVTDQRGLINTTDLLVATGATVILAAGVGGAALSTLNDAKYGKAQPDAQALGNAITQFYKDTGKWPGQAEQAAIASTTKTALFLVTSTASNSTTATYLPTDGAGTSVLTTTTATCENNSLEGFVGTTITGAALSTTNTRNVNDFLVNRPADSDYPSWKGPYLQEQIRTDPWDRSWVINLQPLYCAEKISTAGSSAGNLGFAWILSGGINRTITTNLKDVHLDQSGDDAGNNLGKLVKPGTNNGVAQ